MLFREVMSRQPVPAASPEKGVARLGVPVGTICQGTDQVVFAIHDDRLVTIVGFLSQR